VQHIVGETVVKVLVGLAYDVRVGEVSLLEVGLGDQGHLHLDQQYFLLLGTVDPVPDMHCGYKSDRDGRDLAEWLQRLAINAKFATVLGSIPVSSDTVESEGRQMKQR
jgi:hypothetical protein